WRAINLADLGALKEVPEKLGREYDFFETAAELKTDHKLGNKNCWDSCRAALQSSTFWQRKYRPTSRRIPSHQLRCASLSWTTLALPVDDGISGQDQIRRS